MKKEDSAVELCTKLLVRTAVPKPKSRSSQLKAVQSIAEVALRNTGATRLKTEVVVYSSFSFSSFILLLGLFLPGLCCSRDWNSREQF